jgi:hypothetical protein
MTSATVLGAPTAQNSTTPPPTATRAPDASSSTTFPSSWACTAYGESGHF